VGGGIKKGGVREAGVGGWGVRGRGGDEEERGKGGRGSDGWKTEGRGFLVKDGASGKKKQASIFLLQKRKEDRSKNWRQRAHFSKSEEAELETDKKEGPNCF